MPRKVPGTATYSARRIGGITYLIATGQTPNFNDKVDFEQLPFLIHPPQWGFFFIHQDISLPAMRPFTYEEPIVFPASASMVSVHDSDGIHSVPITDVSLPTPSFVAPTAADPGHCVFERLGMGSLLISRCDAILPAIYRGVFGPATYAECEEYVRDHLVSH